MIKRVKTSCIKGVNLLFIASVLFFSCQKSTDDIQKFDDVFDIRGVTQLNLQIENAQSLHELSAFFKDTEIDVPAGLSELSLEEMINHFESNLKLSSKETDMLLKNDSKTYLEVVNRLGSLPLETEDLEQLFPSVKKSNLKPFLIKQKAEMKNFYSDDYYSAVVAFQKYIQNDILNPMRSAQAKTLAPGNNKFQPGEDSFIIYYKLIVSNNIWDMWWAYWSDGTRTKHKGSAGSFPGN